MKTKEIEIRAINSEEDYFKTMKIIESLLNCENESNDENKLEVL